MDEEPKPNEIKFHIGPYQVLKHIGQEGYNEVYLVYEPVKQRKVALKRYIRRPNDDNFRTQFLTEVRVLAQLDHPNIVSVYDLKEEKDQIYYTMSYIEGETLNQRFMQARRRELEKGPPIAEDEVPTFILQFLKICEIVDYTLSKGIIHRDLKPNNIMIDTLGQPHLVDWGIAIPYDEEKMAAMQRATTVSGTTIYLAPELILGKQANAQSEMYALGLIVYEMLCLRYPFHRDTIETYFRNKEGETLLDPAKVAPHRHIPSELSHIVLKCLADDPKDRYVNFREIIAEVEDYLQKSAKSHEERQRFITAYHDKLINRVNSCKPSDRRSYYSAVLTAMLELQDEKYFDIIKSWKQHIHFKHLYFFNDVKTLEGVWLRQKSMAVHLAFLLALPKTIDAILVTLIKLASSPLPVIEEALMALIELGCGNTAVHRIADLSQKFLDVQAIAHLGWISEAIKISDQKEIQISFLDELPKQLSIYQLRPLYYIFNEALNRNETAIVVQSIEQLSKKCELTYEQQQTFVCYLLWAALLKKNWDVAKELIDEYALENVYSEDYKFLKDCWLHVTQKKEMKLPVIHSSDFLWEQRKKYRYYILYYSCINDAAKEAYFRELEKQTRTLFIPRS